MATRPDYYTRVIKKDDANKKRDFYVDSNVITKKEHVNKYTYNESGNQVCKYACNMCNFTAGTKQGILEHIEKEH